MKSDWTFLLGRHEDHTGFNEWLNQHPAAMGGILIAFGALSLISAVREFTTGRYQTRWGTTKEGDDAILYGFTHAVIGVGLMLFSGSKLLEALS